LPQDDMFGVSAPFKQINKPKFINDRGSVN